MAYDYRRVGVEAEFKDPIIAAVGDKDGDNVGGVGGGKGAWPWYRVGGGGAETGGEVTTHCDRFRCGSFMWGGEGQRLGVNFYVRALACLGVLRGYKWGG